MFYDLCHTHTSDHYSYASSQAAAAGGKAEGDLVLMLKNDLEEAEHENSLLIEDNKVLHDELESAQKQVAVSN